MQENIIYNIPMLTLRGLVLYPNMILHFEVGREKSVLALNKAMEGNRKIFLVSQKNLRDEDPDINNIYSVGVVAEVKQIVKSYGNNLRILVEGKFRAKATAFYNADNFYQADVEELPLKQLPPSKAALSDALVRTIKDLFDEYSLLTPKMPKDLIVNTVVTDDPVFLCEYIASNIPFKVEDKQKILEESNVISRLKYLAEILENEINVLSLERDIQEKVRAHVDKNQRDYYLREQLKVISSELGETDDLQDEVIDYKTKIISLNLSEESEEKLLKEVDRLSKLPSNSHESGVIRGYLDTCLDLPWNKKTKDKIDIAKAKKQLDKDHYGLEKVKDRILEILAVRKLSPDIKGQIICLVGPPGVGKTSIAKSIAKAIGRNYQRVSLGGVRDESDIRGHRKTYIGSMPGRIINAIKLAGSKNPLILLDEIDKMSNDFRGDPSAALLEVLDSEQNFAFRDHFIEIPFDLSDVLFLTTANTLDTIPAPLLDRMEVINLSSYTREEKYNIAKHHLLNKQIKKHGLTARNIKISDEVIYSLIDFYTREAGVRKLERTIAALCRKAAKKIVEGTEQKIAISNGNLEEYLGPKKYRPETVDKEDQIGLTNGLAWTSVGGEMLQVEVAVLDGTGKVELTGSLGDVMKESAHAAISYIRGCCEKYSVNPYFYKEKDIHIHVPEGAVPKDGPSAGITICTALISALTETPVKHDVAMTGEITLRGRVLPIGGLKEKTMAAYRANVKTVIIPKDNEPDLEEIDDVVKQNIKFISADKMETVLSHALVNNIRLTANDSIQSMPVDVKNTGGMQNNTVITQ